MGFYKYVRSAWKQPQATMPELWRERLLKWRQEPTNLRIDRPTRIDRARSLGYRAKQGIIVVRHRIARGGHMRAKIRAGRKPRNFRRNLVLSKNYQRLAEERVNRRFPNCEVLNSYWVAQDGKHYWFEVILVERTHPAMVSDDRLGWITMPHHKGRVFRGLTSQGRKSRGLRNKGQGAEHLRPSVRTRWV